MVWLLFQGGAAASPDVAPVHRVHVSVDAVCTDENDFMGRLRERTLRVDRAAPGETAERVVIRVRDADDHTSGALDIVHEGEPPRSRRVEGTSCDEVVNALSLALALIYDPEALLSIPPPRELEPGPPAIAPPPPLPARPRVDESSHWKVGAQGSVAGTSIWPVGVELFADVMLPGAHAPSARLGLLARRGSTEVAEASASFFSAFATPSVCPLHIGTGPLDVAPCGGIELGVLSATQEGASLGQSFLRPWIAPRAAALASIALGARLSVEAQASLEVPLIRGRYVFGTTRAYEIPVALPALALGLALALD